MKNIDSLFFSNDVLLDIVTELNPAVNPRYMRTNDITSARLFSDIFKNVCRYNVTQRTWNVYDGIVWKTDTEGMEAEKLAKKLTDALYVYSFGVEDENYRKKVAGLGDRRKRTTMLSDARDFNYISTEVLDSNGDLLNLKNCAIDLRTFKVVEHNAGLLLSKSCNVSFDPAARSHDWEKFIDEVMCGDKEKIRYLQKVIGYGLTADASREEFYMFFGSTTRNGKSTTLETISHMLGDYALNMQVESLAMMKRDSRQASGDIARLRGARFVTASEPPKQMLLNVQMLKSLTGRDTITCRNLCEREMEFEPCFKLYMNTNHLPIVTDPTLFTSDRVKVVTFDRHFEPQEQDKGLKSRLRTEENLSGILNWCLDGLKAMRTEGLEPPAPVLTATESYSRDSDKLGLFFKEVMIESEKNTMAKHAYYAYSNWCRASGFGTESKKSFFNELKSRGLMTETGTVNGFTCKNVIIGYEIDDSVSGNDFESCGSSPF